MATITILHNQSLLDVAIQYTGDVTNAFALAVANGISVTTKLVSGRQLIIPDQVEFNADILNYYSAKGLQPATIFEATAMIKELEGIGHWIIENNFKVS